MNSKHWTMHVLLVLCVGLLTAAAPALAETQAEVQTASADEDMLKLLDALAKELQSSGTDCDLAAKKFNAFLDANTATLPAASQALEAHLNTLSPAEEQKFAEKLMISLGVIMTMSQKTCANHDDFHEAHQSFDMLMSGKDDGEQDLSTTETP